MPVGQRKGSKRYYVDFRIRGVRYRIAVPEARTKPEARQAEAKLRTLIFEGKYEAAAKPTKLSDYLDRQYLDYCKANVKQWKQRVSRMNLARDFFTGKHLHEISPFHVEKYKLHLMNLDTRQGRKRAPSTIKVDLTVLSHIFSRAVSEGLLRMNPCKDVKRPKVEDRVRYLSDEEEEALRSALKDHPDQWLKDVVLLALNTGLRRNELLNLTWDRVDLSRSVLTITKTKTCTAREVPLTEEPRNILLARRSQHDRVFVRGKKVPHSSTLNRGFSRLMELAGIENFHLHDLRHTFATRLLDKGVQETVIARILGHGALAMTVKYAHVTDQRIRAAVSG